MAAASEALAEGRRACLDAWAIGANARPPAAGAWAPVARGVAALPWPVASAAVRSPWGCALAVVSVCLVAGVVGGVLGSRHG